MLDVEGTDQKTGEWVDMLDERWNDIANDIVFNLVAEITKMTVVLADWRDVDLKAQQKKNDELEKKSEKLEKKSDELEKKSDELEKDRDELNEKSSQFMEHIKRLERKIEEMSRTSRPSGRQPKTYKMTPSPAFPAICRTKATSLENLTEEPGSPSGGLEDNTASSNRFCEGITEDSTIKRKLDNGSNKPTPKKPRQDAPTWRKGEDDDNSSYWGYW